MTFTELVVDIGKVVDAAGVAMIVTGALAATVIAGSSGGS
jgi:hypothetical protein